MSARFPTGRGIDSPGRGEDSADEVDEPRTSQLRLQVASTAVSLGVIYGYDLSNIGAALLYIADEFHLCTKQQGMVMTAVVIGEIAGAAGGGVLANAIGRKKSMVLVAAAYAAFAVLGALSVSLPMLMMARLLLGVTIGVSVVVVPVFVAESAPAKVRGSLLIAYQLATVVGAMVGYLVAYVLASSHGWRWMLGLAAVPALLIMSQLLSTPETARWYLLKGRVDQARQALRQLEPGADIEHRLAGIAHALKEASHGEFAQMLRRPYLRTTVFVVGLGFFAHITGVNAVMYYAPRLLAAMGFAGNCALFVLPALAQVAPLAAAVISLFVVDRLGRRRVLLSGIAMMLAADAGLVGAFALGPSDLPGFGFVGVVVFTAGFSFGFGGLLSVYAGESLPSRLRSMGSSAILASDLVAKAIVTAVFLPMLHSLGGAGTFAVFGGLAAAAFVFVYRLAPETTGSQLEDILRLWENGRTPPEGLTPQ